MHFSILLRSILIPSVREVYNAENIFSMLEYHFMNFVMDSNGRAWTCFGRSGESLIVLPCLGEVFSIVLFRLGFFDEFTGRYFE